MRMVEQAARAVPATVVKPKLRYPWWAYPSVAAAVVAITFLSWWGNQQDMPLKIESPIAKNTTPPATDETNQIDEIKETFARSNITQPEKSVASLDTAEDQLAELSRNQSQTFGFSDGNE